MKVNFQKVVTDVRLRLNLDERHQSLIDCADISTLSIDRIIRSLMPEAVRLTETEAPVEMLESGYNFADSADLLFVPRGGDAALTVASVVVPPEFMRLVGFRLSDWTAAVTSVITPASPLYALMQLPGASALADNARPLGALVRKPEGLTLVTYSRSSPSATIADAFYRPLPAWDTDGAIDVSSLLCDASLARCASLTAAILSNNS